MKKIMTLCFFAFAMILGTQNSSAQSMVEINSVAAKQTQELKKAVKFNSDTEDLVYKAYQLHAQKMYSVNKTVAEGGTISAEDQKKIDTMLTEKFKNIFTEQEFQLYLSFADKQK